MIESLSATEYDMAMQNLAKKTGIPLLTLRRVLADEGVTLARRQSARILEMRGHPLPPCDTEVTP